MIHDATELSAKFPTERSRQWTRAGDFLKLSRQRLAVHGQALLWAAASTIVAFLAEPYTVVEELAMIHLLGVLVIAVRSDVRVSLFATFVSILSFAYFFVPPRLSFALSDGNKTLTFVAMIVVATVISRLNERLRRSRIEGDTERLRNSLLNSLSHDLKTPLSTIVTAGSALLDHRGELDSGTCNELLSTIVEEAERLSGLVQNVLTITRLESPTIELRRTPETVDDILNSAVMRLGPPLAARPLGLDIPSDLPLVLAEPKLIELVLLNLLENALRYTPAGSPIDVSARTAEGLVMVQIADRGPGVREGDEERVFAKFYRGPQSDKDDGGIGLGLTICRAIIRAHGGRIEIRQRPDGGAVVEFTLPAQSKGTDAPLAVEDGAC